MTIKTLYFNQLTHLMPIEHSDGPTRLSGLQFVVSDHDDGTSVLRIEPMKDTHYFRPHFGIEVTGRFVGEDNLGIAYNGAGNGHALALTSGELLGIMAQPMRHFHALEDFVRRLSPFTFAHAAIEERQHGVVQHVERIDEMKTLKYESQLFIAESGQSLVVHGVYRLSEDFHRPRGRTVQQTHDVEERTLAASARSHDGKELAAVYADVDILQSGRFHQAGTEDATHVGQFDCIHIVLFCFVMVSFYHSLRMEGRLPDSYVLSLSA